MRFYGRDAEVAELKKIEELSRQTARFTVVTGRRRVGKTELIDHVFNTPQTHYLYLLVTGRTEKDLCSIFQEEMQHVLTQPILGQADRFAQLFESIMLYSYQTPITVVIDEFQEFDKINSAIFAEMQGVWDRHHKRAKLNLVVCGSVNRLMSKIFFDDSQPLYGRTTGKLHLTAFPVELLKEILQEHYAHYTPQDLLALWTLTGGVARYVELFMDAKAYTRRQMIAFVCSLTSSYIDEGRMILSDEFGKEYGTYFTILAAIAAGKTSFAEIKNVAGSEIGGHLTKLESVYGFISKKQPAYEKPSSRNYLYEIDDCFFKFWFRFIYKYMHLVEQRQLGMLSQIIERDFDVFSGGALEQYFKLKFLAQNKYTTIARWWDRKGENEIDLVCENELEQTLDFFEVKLNPDRYNPAALERKCEAFRQKHPEKSQLKQSSSLLSLSDM